MKYFFTIFAFLLTYFNVNSQPVTQDEQTTGIHELIGNYSRSEIFTGSDTAWINSKIRIQSYNEDDMVTVFQQQTWDSANWINETKYEYSYVNNSLTSSIVTYEWMEENWIEDSKSEFEYDKNERIIQSSEYYVEEIICQKYQK